MFQTKWGGGKYTIKVDSIILSQLKGGKYFEKAIIIH